MHLTQFGRPSALALCLAAVLASAPAFAQQQAASAQGRLATTRGAPAAGVAVTFTHEASGTVTRVVTDPEGRYLLRGLRVGGPYRVEAENGAAPLTDVYLPLDRTTQVDLTVAEPVRLDSVVVHGAVKQTGAGTVISGQQLQLFPTLDGNIQDYARLDPRVVQTDRSRNELTVGGQNPRYNSIRVDGAKLSDTFGLELNNLPTPHQPFALESIEAMTVDVVNYDAAVNGAVGGYINAITKSGTNDFHGSVYGTYRDHNLVRKNDNGTDFTGFNQERTLGATFGGPILRDRVFFFLDYEDYKLTEQAPSYGPIGSNASVILPITQGDLDTIRNIAINRYGFDPGVVGTPSAADTTAHQFGIKLDWNISDAHRLSYRHSSSRQSQANFPGFSPNSLTFDSYYFQKRFDVDVDTLHLFSNWSDRVSTEATLSHQGYVSERKPARNLPGVGVVVGSVFVLMGTEENSYLNRLETNTWNGAFAANLFLGDHTLKMGADVERNGMNNLYARRANGTYAYFGINNFANGIATPFRYSHPRDGDVRNMAADWTLTDAGVFLQDTWEPTDRFSLTLGLRYDRPTVDHEPIYNPAASAAFGYDNRSTIDGNGLLQPRLSMRYRLDDSTTLRGGVGLFQGTAPGVWLSNAYSNTGLNYTDYNLIGIYPVNPDPTTQIDSVPSNARAGTQSIDLTDPNLGLPSIWKANFAVDKKLPWWGATATAELVLGSVEQGIYYQNLNLGPATRLGQDGRQLFWNAAGYDPANWNQIGAVAATARTRSLANPAYTDVLIVRPTNKGESRQLSFEVQKPFNGSAWSWFASYTFTDATEVSPLTSSNSYAQWANPPSFDPNEERSARSQYEIRDRFTAALSFRRPFFAGLNTSASLFYEGRSGRPMSYVFDNDANGDGRQGNDLLYIPTGPGDVRFGSPAEEAAFWSLVNSDPYLTSHRGQVAERNAVRAPWVNRFDLRVSQELPGFAAGHKAELWLDVFNLGNLLNRNWGQMYDVLSPANFGVVEFGGVCGATVTAVCSAGSAGKYVYRVNTPDQRTLYDNKGVSRWSVSLGIRYRF